MAETGSGRSAEIMGLIQSVPRTSTEQRADQYCYALGALIGSLNLLSDDDAERVYQHALAAIRSTVALDIANGS